MRKKAKSFLPCLDSQFYDNMNTTVYTSEWRKLSRTIRFGRAGGCCEGCGARHGSIHPRTGSIIYLTTAHLDRNAFNNADSNLMALCPECHFAYDRRDNKQIRQLRRLVNENVIPLFSA
jgi:hypothetical protein